MSKLERISKAGLWPRVLNADLAAIYCCVSKSQFYLKVEDGTYPKPFENGSLVQWDRFDLDEAIDRLKSTDNSTPKDALSEALDEWTPPNSA